MILINENISSILSGKNNQMARTVTTFTEGKNCALYVAKTFIMDMNFTVTVAYIKSNHTYMDFEVHLPVLQDRNY